MCVMAQSKHIRRVMARNIWRRKADEEEKLYEDDEEEEEQEGEEEKEEKEVEEEEYKMRKDDQMKKTYNRGFFIYQQTLKGTQERVSTIINPCTKHTHVLE